MVVGTKPQLKRLQERETGELIRPAKKLRLTMDLKKNGTFFEQSEGYLKERGWAYEDFGGVYERVRSLTAFKPRKQQWSQDPPAFGMDPLEFDVGVVRFRDVNIIVGQKAFVIFRGDKVATQNAGIPERHRSEYGEPQAHIDVLHLTSGKDNSDSICHNIVDVVPNDILFRDWMGVDPATIGFVEPKSGHVKLVRGILCPDGMEIRPDVVYSVGELVIPAASISTDPIEQHGHPAFKGNPETVAKLGRVVEGIDTSTDFGPRIYFSRRDSVRRMMTNEAELVEALAPHGFVELKMGDLSPEDQVRAAYGAEVIVGPHGAAFTNILFCKPTVRVVEVMSHNKHTLAYAILAHAMGITYVPVRDRNECEKRRWRLSQDGLKATVHWATTDTVVFPPRPAPVGTAGADAEDEAEDA